MNPSVQATKRNKTTQTGTKSSFHTPSMEYHFYLTKDKQRERCGIRPSHWGDKK
ncbi:hypothetical protein ACIPZ8_22325 [Pseudomonas sp. NPDC089422]|uniref:hypothetical protein n=1 Tax=Pseudomonas sp. NPDC089422 TaxID=3364466 RepID=UPI00382AC3ED